VNTSFRQSSFARGFTLVELMVALAIGLLMAFGLVRVFASSSDAYRALAQASQQIENGRYAIQMVSQDLQHAGFYGEYGFCPAPGITDSNVCVIPPTVVALPDPCEIADAAIMKTGLAFFVQAYSNVAASPVACIDNANVLAGTDVLVIRRANTSAIASGALVANEVYMQANADSTNIDNPVIAFGTFDAAKYPLLNRLSTGPAEIRKYHVIIYFVSPCSETVGGVCTAGSDGGRPIPTLKRLMLGLSGGALTMRVEPVAEGIQNLQIDYGVDTDRDGVPDGNFLAAPAAVFQWGDVMAAQVRVLARTVDPNPGWNDTKTYDLGTAGAYTPAGADTAFQRHLFVSQVRLVNPAGRREVP